MDIKQIAESYLGQKEVSPNASFVSASFQSKMEKVGWYKGAAWCLFLARLIQKEAGHSIDLIRPSAYQTINKATAAGNWHVTPIVGAVAVFSTFKNGKRQTTGHGATVVEVSEDGTEYKTVDGNTTDKGGREGIMVAVRNRHLNADSWTKENGLRLMGFVYPS